MVIVMLKLYEKLSSAAYLLTKPFLELWSRWEGPDGMWPGRLGHISPELVALGPQDIWLQAVSVGEVAVAEAIVKALDHLLPNRNLRILVSSTTPAGFARAISALGDRCSVIPYPLDFPQVVRRLVLQLKPKVYASLETELWPNLLRAVQRSGGKTILLNGRISVKSFPRYMKLKSLVGPLLTGFTRICAISEVHAERLRTLGAPGDRVSVTGNAKFEGLLARPNPSRVAALRDRLNVPEPSRVFVAGSLRSGEESQVVRAYLALRKRWPEMIFFAVPRHLGLVSVLEKALKAKGVSYNLWSGLDLGKARSADVIIVDVIGPLFDLYGLATAAFVGGSLVPRGGQNIMEPAAWGCPVFYGPHMDNFEEAKTFMEQYEGGCQVKDGEDLGRCIERIFHDAGERERMGYAALSALKELACGAATRQAKALLEALDSSDKARP